MTAENGRPPSGVAPGRAMLKRWVEHAFDMGWVCVRSYPDGGGHRARDEYAKSSYRPSLQECLDWAGEGNNVEVLLHESSLLQVDAEAGAPAPWGDPAAHGGACLSRSAGAGLHAVYSRPDCVEKHRWIKRIPSVDLLSKGVWPLPGCRRTGDERKESGEWAELAPPVAPCAPPQWVIDSIPKGKPRRPPSEVRAGPHAEGWATAALTRELAEVANAPAGDGRAHAQMMSSGARLGQIVGAGLLDRESVMEQLIAAAVSAGWEEREARRCANDAVEFGTKNPRGPAELPDIEIVNGAAAEPPREHAKVTPETGASAPPEPNQDQSPPDSPPEPDPPEDIETLDDALALLEQAKEAGDVQVLFRHAKALAALLREDEAIFLQEAKKAFEKELAKTELAAAIRDRRKTNKEDDRKKAAASAKTLRQRRRQSATETLHVSASKSNRREIQLHDGDVTRDPIVIHHEAVASLVARNTPEYLFLRGRRPARIGVDEEGQPEIERIKDKEMQSELIRSAIFIGHNKSGLPQPVDPPVATIRTLLGCGDLPFPRLAGIVRGPVVRRDGTILMQQGYDKETGLYYQADSGLIIPMVASAPTKEDVVNARELILDVFIQFPFVTEASRANSVALMLTSFLQPVVDDHRPLCAITAYQPGSGKGEIASASSRVCTGRPPRMTRLRREDEFEKKLAHLMFCGAPFICIDNAKGRLESETLESTLTIRRFSDRRLGRNDDGFEVPQEATWCATGNNLELGTEMARRSYLVELDPKDPHPEDREGPRPGEKFKRLPEWVTEHRGELIWAVLTLCRDWFAGGCPRPKLSAFGNFDRWQEVVGGVLEVAGIPEFLANRSQLRSEQDEERRQWSAFVHQIRLTLGSKPFTTRELREKIDWVVVLKDALPDELASHLGKDDFVQQIGTKLSKRKGTRLADDGLRVVRLEDEGHEKVAQWQVLIGEEKPHASAGKEPAP